MRRTRYFLYLVSAFVIVGFFGCATPLWRVPSANLALGQLTKGNYEKAWEMISAELRSPTVSSREDLCEIHVAALQILDNIVLHNFAPANADEVAQISYNHGCDYCQSLRKKRIAVENNYGLYIYNTRRPGLAIPYFKRAIKLSEEISFEMIINEGNLASCYADMGKFELRDYHRLRAIQIGRKYFKTRRKYKYRSSKYLEWMNYRRILQSRLDELSWQKSANNLSEMRHVWKEIEIITKKWISKSTQYIDYCHAAQHFAAAGDTSFARELLNTARVMTKKYPYKNRKVARLDLQATEGKILGAEDKWKKAAALFEDWIMRFQKVSGKNLSANSFRLVGLAHESAQNYDRAIDYLLRANAEFEKMRATFKVRSRGRVLSGLAVESYWGLIRSYAARYLKQRREEDFHGAVKAARMLRARQFGELLGISHQIDGDLGMARLKLSPDELLVNMILTDHVIGAFAISSEWHDLFIIPYDRSSFRTLVSRAKSHLLAPGSQEAFRDDLQAISNIVLKPLRGRVDKFYRLIIISDGRLNGIPFILLSNSSDQYRPLILDHEIVLTPSISYLIAERSAERHIASEKLLALADPTYGSRAIPEAYRDATRSLYERAIGGLNLFTPLPETRTEVSNIAHLFRSPDVTVLLGGEATESNVKSLQLDGYRYLHFATHGILGNQIPGVDEPALVLAAESRESDQDGFLTLSEVEELKLNSDLAVLSACDTGRGKYFTGEGIMGLSRGFLLAGSRSVIVSLWPVSSEATVELMTLFYQHLRSGKSKAESLRLAQLAMMHGTETRTSSDRGIKVVSKTGAEAYTAHPFYWAPFVLIGE
jgi:CHAT domain-containing protein